MDEAFISGAVIKVRIRKQIMKRAIEGPVLLINNLFIAYYSRS
jgi:hypothetical protein